MGGFIQAQAGAYVGDEFGRGALSEDGPRHVAGKYLGPDEYQDRDKQQDEHAEREPAGDQERQRHVQPPAGSAGGVLKNVPV